MLSGKLDIPIERLPGSYQIIGDILLIKFRPGLEMREKKAIASAILDLFSYVRTVCEISRITGELRLPKIKILASREKKPKLITTHKEHGILYKLDVSKIMFSKGNLLERSRLIKQIRDGEVVADMFAGIGYFSLGIAKFSRAKKIYAIEKNRIAFNFLKENIKLNKIENISPILGDCRKIKKIKADRVIMGYFPNTQKFLPAAFRFLKKRGVIHYHNIYREKELWFKPLNELENAAKRARYKIVSILGRRVVKSYAPHVFHVVIDCEFEKK